MAKGNLSEETIRFIMTAESSELVRESKKSAKELKKLQEAHEALRKEQQAVGTVFGKSSKEYKEVTGRLKQNETQIANTTKKLTEMHKRLGADSMTMAELRREARHLQIQLDNTSKALAPEQYAELANRLQEVKGKMAELKAEAQGGSEGGGFLKNLLGSKIDFASLKTMTYANGIAKIGGIIFDSVTEYAGRAFNRIKELVAGSVQAAREAQGITHAFEQMNRPDILDNLRKATHGTVSDLELMKSAVQAQDFRLPLDQLGKYLEFAQLKAQQTGQSVDYMTNSIVTGLGRKSVMILDNLGISASEIKEEMAKTGDMATAVGNIIDRQLADAGEHFETAAEREAQATTDVSNAQLALGNQMQRTFGIGNTSFKEMQAKAETFILNGLTRLIVYLQDLYDRLGSVRVIVEAVKVAFDTVFKICELGFDWLIDTVKAVGRVIRDFAEMLEGVISFDPGKAGRAWDNLMKDISKSVKEFADDGKDVGTRWGSNVIESIKSVMGKAKIKSPAIEGGKGSRAVSPQGVEDDKKANSHKESDPYQQDIAVREQQLREYTNLLRQMLMNQLLTEEEYHEESAQAELKFLADKLALQEKYGKDVSEVQGQYLDKVISEANRQQKVAEQQLQAELQQLQLQHSQQEADLLRQRKEGIISTDEEYNQRRIDEEIKYHVLRLQKMKEGSDQYVNEQKRLAQLELQQLKSDQEKKVHEYEQTYQRIAQQQLKSAQDLETMRNSTRSAWEQHLISYEQYQKRMTEITEMEAGQRQRIEQAAFQSVSQLMQSTSSLFSALQSREMSQVDAKYKKLIAAAKKQGKDTTKLEEQQEAEKMEIQKKYAQKQFRLQVLQIIAATAQSIANVWREWAAFPAVAAALTAVAAAQGAIQLATAKAQADQASGLYGGGYSEDYVEGYTRRGSDSRKQAGVIPVHQNEFVANHQAVANPQVRPVLDVIDRHQRMGDIRMLNATRMLDEAYGRGRYQGGFTGGGDGSGRQDGQGGGDGQRIVTGDRTIQLLEDIRRNTGRSLTVRSLREEIAHEEQLERNARR